MHEHDISYPFALMTDPRKTFARNGQAVEATPGNFALALTQG